MRNITVDLERLDEIRRQAEQAIEDQAHLLLRRIYVPPCGPVDPTFLIIGESPGELEEEQGRPFCGASGQLLREMLRKAGIPENLCSYTNVLKVRPATSLKYVDGSKQDKKRKPTLEEIQLFAPTLLAEIEVYQPKVIIAAGATAAGIFAGETDFRIMRRRGEIFIHGDRNTPVMPTYHPSFLVHRRREKGGLEHREMMEDLRDARRLA